MNKVLLNTVNLDGGYIIKKGSGGGGGNTPGGGGSDMPVIGDGKTYLYIKIAEKGRMNVPLYFSQTVANGVTIDWGDGSAKQTLSGTGNRSTTHNYADKGDYVISLEAAERCTLGLGNGTSSSTVLGGTSGHGYAYTNMLRKVEIGNGISRIDSSTFRCCYSLDSIVIPDGVTYIGGYAFGSCYSLNSVVIPDSVTSMSDAFQECYALDSIVIPDSVTSLTSELFNKCHSLASVVIPNSVTSIGSKAFYECKALASIVIPASVTSIGGNAFNGCYSLAYIDFRSHTSVPSLSSNTAFSNSASDCKIVVPDALYDEWVAATNWSTYASKIVKASEFNG